MLQSEGVAVARGLNDEVQGDFPALVADMTYSKAAAGVGHAVLRWSDGVAVACG